MREIETVAHRGTLLDERCRHLNDSAHDVRQWAVDHGQDIEGWRLARLMRDADTDTQVKIAERRYGLWLRRAYSLGLGHAV